MIAPVFYTDPGNEMFVPKVAHPGEDAGADICANVFWEEDYVVDGFLLKWTQSDYARLFVDGVEYEFRPGLSALTVSDKLRSQYDGAVLLEPNQRVLVDSGFKIILPNLKNLGAPWNSLICVYKIVSRSGLAAKHGVVVSNSPGIIDSGYQDFVKVSLHNTSSDYHMFTRGARIAQGLCEVVIDQSKAESTTNSNVFNVTARSTGGLGSTRI